MSLDQARLDRIEEKIDKLVDTVIALARAEEKLINLEEDLKTLVQRSVESEKLVAQHEKRITDTEMTVIVIRRIFWIVVSCIITTLGGIYITQSAQHHEPVKQEIHSQVKP